MQKVMAKEADAKLKEFLLSLHENDRSGPT